MANLRILHMPRLKDPAINLKTRWVTPVKEATCSSEVQVERVVKMEHGPKLPHVQVGHRP